jgi:hypothetical protein
MSRREDCLVMMRVLQMLRRVQAISKGSFDRSYGIFLRSGTVHKV